MSQAFSLDWTRKHFVKINDNYSVYEDEIDGNKIASHRRELEPWLSAIFQSEHLSLLIGSGLTNAVCYMSGVIPQMMSRLELNHSLKDKIEAHADKTALTMDRGEANIEDDIRSANELLAGLHVLEDARAGDLKAELDDKLHAFIGNILKTEAEFHTRLLGKVGADKSEKAENYTKAQDAFNVLKSFLLSFSSRAASRDRLNIFTANYDRFIEVGCDEAGVILLDRFKGKLTPIFRNTRLELDYHYNPPGIRGEPRYVEGVVRITKLHGSIDWRFEQNRIVRSLLPFGADISHPELPAETSDRVVIYPNSSKDIETAFYPYAELFRDFSSAICRPNSVIVTYGYGFGDTHINRIMEDMLTIPSTHIVIIAYDRKDASGSFGPVRDRIKRFYDRIGNPSQFTILLGEHFGDLNTLVENYLPKSAIDRITNRKQKLLEGRGEGFKSRESVSEVSADLTK